MWKKRKEKGMKSKVKLLLEFAKGKQPTSKIVRVFSVIGDKKELVEEYPVDAPVSIDIEVFADNKDQLQMQNKNINH